MVEHSRDHAIDAVFSPRAHVEQILRFEVALARASARAGLIPPHAAAAIEAVCRVDRLDVEALRRDGATAGSIVIPLVQALNAQVDREARGLIHWGATSQDAIDTAMVLQMAAGLDLLEIDLRRIGEAASTLATTHRQSVMPGRTLLQQAVPIPFGLKAARWLGGVTRQLRAVERLRRHDLVLQFGGAAGTLAALGDRGEVIAGLLGQELGLPVPDLPWHAERDRPATVVATLGVTAGLLAKIAGDLVLLSQTEIGEIAEGAAPGKGGSSAMPQKRNPVDAVSAAASARLAMGLVPVMLAAMPQEHERSAGGWQAEWTALPDAFRHTVRAAAHLASALTMLEVHPERMRANLDAGGGAVMAESLATALAPRYGRSDAMQIVAELSRSASSAGRSLRDAAGTDERVTSTLSADELARALDPAAYLGSSDRFIDRALASWRALTAPQSSP